MTDKNSQGPLGSDQLERDWSQAGEDKTLGDAMASDERAPEQGEDGDKRPDPPAGTMLPPD